MLASSLGGATVALQPAGAASVAPAMGTVDPTTNFPTWYGDSNGTRLELCLDGAPNCLAAASDLVAPDGEAFWFDATSDLPTPAGKSLITLGTEAAYAGPGVGQESVFNRTRLRINTPNTGSYTVTWPYGTKTYNVTEVSSAKFEINETIDLGCIAAPPDNTCNDAAAPNFSDVTSSLQPFLKWDPSVAPAAPVGFLGDAATPHKVVGSPLGTNVFQVDGPNIGGPGINTIKNDLWVIQGKLAGPLASTPAKPSLNTADVPTTTASGTTTTQTVTLKNLGSAPLTVSSVSIDPASTNPTDFAVTPNTCPAALALDATCAVTVSFTPTATGARTANLLVTHNQIRSPLSIPLKGFGKTAGTAAAVSLSSASLTWGSTHVGSESPEQVVKVTNTGTAPLNISKVALAGANPGEFKLTADCTDQRVDPGLGCPVGIAFTPAHGGTRTATLVISDDAAGSPQQSVGLTGTGAAGLVAVGAIDPTTHFPTYYQDSNGLALENCLAGAPNCLAAATDLTPGVAGATGEAFWFDATSSLTLPKGGKAGLVLATEAAFATGDPVAGQEISFSRIRFNATAGLVPGAQYKVTHPYGVDLYQAVTSGSVARNAGTSDVGCLAAPCGDFSQLMSSRVGPFLQWDPAVKPAPPAGYIGDAATDHPVIGSPFGTNIFRIEGPDVNPNPQTDACPSLVKPADYPLANCIETNLFVLQGKIGNAAPAPAPVPGSDTVAPTVSISAPAAGATVSGTINVTASAADNVGMGSVQFQLDGVNLGSAATFSPYTTSWNTTAATNGAHTLRAIATDTSGNTTTSASVTVTVSNGAAAGDTTAPTVSISAPGNGATVSGRAVAVTATASDNVGVTSVTLNLDGAPLATVTTAPFTTTWNTTRTPNGPHTLTAVASDLAGNTKTSATVTVNVNNVTAPTASLSSTTMDFGTLARGQTATKTVTLKNGGTAPLNISNIAIGGTSAFTISGQTCGATLAVGASCNVTVRFAPTAVTAYSGTLTFTDDAAPGTQTVSLTGSGK
jgi:Bacterial Ig domain/Abnormal spindle-like microcephaly-assoc'd, ASPM-SPD-2-Hydin